MGFSVSGATAIVFIGLLISAAALYPAVDSYTERRADALDDREERALAQQNTDIRIVNASYDQGTGVLTLEVENTGASTLTVAELDVLVDGSYAALEPDDTVVASSAATEFWAPGERLTVTFEPSTAPPDRVKLVTGPAVAVTAQVEVV
jgi:flagellar protein FlaF